jgi:hypothetical protein
VAAFVCAIQVGSHYYAAEVVEVTEANEQIIQE